MINTNPIFKVAVLLFFATIISSFYSTRNHNTNFQNYCWPVLGKSDTTLVYKYEMSCIDYDKKWYRYFKIKSFTDHEIRYFDYQIYNDELELESHYRYQLDHLGIKLKAMETNCGAKDYLKGKIDQDRVFDWNLKKGKTCSSSMIFDDYQGNQEMTVISNSKFEGNGGKIHYHDAKLPAIMFSRNVTSLINGDSTKTRGVSYYAKGIGYYASHIVLNETIEFDEVLVDILPKTNWELIQKERANPTDRPED